MKNSNRAKMVVTETDLELKKLYEELGNLDNGPSTSGVRERIRSEIARLNQLQYDRGER